MRFTRGTFGLVDKVNEARRAHLFLGRVHQRMLNVRRAGVHRAATLLFGGGDLLMRRVLCEGVSRCLGPLGWQRY